MSKLPKLGKIKAQYHAGSDTHYVLGWNRCEGDKYPDAPDLSIKVEKSGGYADDTDTREEVARLIVNTLTEAAM